MPAFLLDLLSWTFAFIVLFFGIRYLQNRKNKKDDDS